MSEFSHAMEHDRRILPRGQVNLSHQSVHVGVPTDPDAPSPSLRIVRSDDQITGIEITCTCGCKMSILCNYDA